MRGRTITWVGCAVFLLVLTGHASIVGYHAFRAAEHLVSAKENVVSGDFDFAKQDLGDASKHLHQFNRVAAPYRLVGSTPLLGSQVRALFDVSDAALLLVRAISGGVDIAQGAVLAGFVQRGAQSPLQDISPEKRRLLLRELLRAVPESSGGRALVMLAQAKARSAVSLHPIAPIVAAARVVEQATTDVGDLYDRVTPFLELFPAVAGALSEQRYLFLFQNNTEVRATGGFIGTYGIATVKDGAVVSVSTHNVATLDKSAPASFYVAPPDPIARHFPGKGRGWFFRDSNWSPDFPESAEKALWFYRQETGRDEHFDGVVAITPDVIADLLSVTGPIEADGIRFEHDTFTETLEYEVEKGYLDRGVKGRDRKQIVGHIVEQLSQRIMELQSTDIAAAVKSIRKNLDEKHILFYFRDGTSQRIASQLGWSGEVRSAHSDYLMVIDSNMASLKTDAVISRAIQYRLLEDKEGNLVARVQLTYGHSGGFDWKTTYYHDYVRVYVPMGSRLLRSHGFGDRESRLGQNAQIDILQEHDKLAFGGFLVVDPGRSKRVSLEYVLPSWLSDQISRGEYSLMVQKQSGLSNQLFDGSFSFTRPIRSVSESANAVQTSSTSILLPIQLYTDQSLRVSF